MTTERRVEWGPIVLAAIGLGLLLFGVWRFYLRPHFALNDALACALLIVPATMLLLVVSYVIQHARLVAVIPIVFTGMLANTYPSFAVALGVALLGMIVEPVMEGWKETRRRRTTGSSSSE